MDSNDHGWILDSAWGINDSGQIIAGAITNSIGYHAVLLTPVPEPSTIILAA